MSTQPFKAPRPSQGKPKEITNVLRLDSSDSTSTTEDMQEEQLDAGIESLVRDEIQLWLSSHGSKLFALEASKFNAAEAKRKNLRGHR